MAEVRQAHHIRTAGCLCGMVHIRLYDADDVQFAEISLSPDAAVAFVQDVATCVEIVVDEFTPGDGEAIH